MVTMYSTHCPKCKQLENLLIKGNIDYEVIDDVEYMTKEIGLKGNMPKLQTEDGKILEYAQAWRWAKDNAKEA